MIAYAIRRIALIIPTLFAIMVVNFVIVQAAPGGPVEQMISRLKGSDGQRDRAGQRRHRRVQNAGRRLAIPAIAARAASTRR